MKKHKIRLNPSATVGIAIYFMVFAVIVFLLLLFLSILFFNTRYEEIYRRQLQTYGDEIVRCYRKSEINEIRKIHEAKGVFILVFQVNGISGTQKIESLLVNGFSDAVGTQEFSSFQDFVEMLDSTDGRATTYVSHEGGASSIIYGNSEDIDGETVYFYVSAVLIENAGIQRVMIEHVVIIAVLSVVTGLILSMRCSRRVLAPITSVTETARNIALGNTEANFYAVGYKEAGELTEQLNYAKKELKQSELIQQEFIANVSHDLRTPLTMIKAYAEMIQDISGDNPEKRGQHTQIIIEESDRLSLLVNDIMQLSRLQTGHIGIKREAVNFSEMVERVVRHFKVLEETKSYVFNTNIRKGIIVRADPKRLEQVVNNLIANAVNYTGPDKKVYVEVSIKDGRAFFQVSDTGKGIEPEFIDNIWGKYYRLNKHSTVKGTGLGLSIVKTILEEHQFYYGVNSVVNHGTSFWFFATLVNRKKRRPFFPSNRPYHY